MEEIIDIAGSIKRRLYDESNRGMSNRAIARVLCEKRGSEVTYFLTNKENGPIAFGHDIVGNATTVNAFETTSTVEGQAVYKNTLLGRALIGPLGVNAQYKAPRGMVSVIPLTRAIYSPSGANAEDVQILRFGDSNIYAYQTLDDLLKLKSEVDTQLKAEQDRLEANKREQERLKREEAEAKARAAEEERARIEAARLRKEREEQAIQEEIKIAHEQRASIDEKIKQQRDILHKNVMLRSQHILDTIQEDAKRSHIYDGVPVVIDGGPGTGKTTTVIQRLKFLLSMYQLREDYPTSLTVEQLKRFADPHRWSQQWLFFSPTDLLLQYLRHNMQEEELFANETNTRTIERFRKVMLREYGIIDPAKPKFNDWKDKSGALLIEDPKQAILQFETFCINQIELIRNNLLACDVQQYDWVKEAKEIQKICNQHKVTDIPSMMRFLEALYACRDLYVKDAEDILKDALDHDAMAVKRAVVNDASAVNLAKELFAQWKKDAKQTALNADDDDETEDDGEESSEAESVDFDAELYTNIRRIVRNLGLKKVDSNARVRGRLQNLLEIVDPFIKKMIDDDELRNIGEYVLFSKVFSTACRGTESLFINKIPFMYKLFRKDLMNRVEIPYNKTLLEQIVKKGNNRFLHADEQDLLLGYINNALIAFSKVNKPRFNDLKGKSAKAYKEYSRPIIGVDEATDYTLMDYYCMISFRFNEFASITLSGDLMQGMHKNGIQSWNSLKELFPSLEVFSLNISYRQTPTLVEMAREMYKDSMGEYPAYNSNKTKSDAEAKPILLVSDDETEKVSWICNHIVDIYKKYELLPSIAIFVGENVNVGEFIEAIENTYILNGIEVVDCTGGKALDSKEVVRVFRLSEIKGMEFEAAFFYDIDTAIQGKSSDLMRRNLYVGVSRAASHLAATMTTADGNEDIIKYFETQNTEW